jgi:2-keto-4-pentenoate hydratase/2-oxohepta-3-ene-1,7-dioic acid hydratase in catechol pathway
LLEQENQLTLCGLSGNHAQIAKMKLAQFKRKNANQPRIGLLLGDVVCDVTELARVKKIAGAEAPDWLIEATSTLEIITRGPEALEEISALVTRNSPASSRSAAVAGQVDEIDFLPAVYPGKILAIGRNYADHAIEGGGEPPKAPLIFAKLSNALSAHNAPIVLPTVSETIDWEAELAIVIGRRAKAVSEADALDYVFGYTLMNDVTARDLQRKDGQWTRGKGLDTFAPLGPFITTRDEIEDIQNLTIEGLYNGEVTQTSNTSKMIFSVAYLISYISQGITLEPGDIIASGTPEGVGFFRDPPVLLKPGDVCEVRVEKLGALRNRVVAPR